jgi:hypothetical protein
MTIKFIKIWILLSLLISSTACSTPFSRPITFSQFYQTGDTYMGIQLRGTIKLANSQIKGIKIAELSGLAWDEDEGILYAISDNGYLFHLRPVITKNILTDVTLMAGFRLRNKKGQRLPSSDAEGLAILKGNNGRVGDSQLIISFERKPQIARFRPNGQLLSHYTLPKKLRNRRNYYSTNKMLESVSQHPRFGILTAPEWPFKRKNRAYSLKGQHQQTIYALNGKQWTFPAYPAPNSAIVALEVLENNSLLVLERAFVSAFKPLIISLRQLQLFRNGKTEVKQIATFNNHRGWQIDNFEGLTHHRNNYFFMISDDNDHALQATLLSYWKLVNGSSRK